MKLINTLKHSFWICWKDLLEFRRSKLRLVMLVLMPLFMMVMTGYIFPSNNTITNIPVAVANEDTGPYGSIFYDSLKAANNETHMMILSDAINYADIKLQIQDGNINAGILIGENFSSELLSGHQGIIEVILDQTNPQMSLMIQTALNELIRQLGIQYALFNLGNISYAEIVPFSPTFSGIYPGNPSYFEFMVPGIMTMVVMMALMTGLPHAISYEKDIGTLDGMLTAPIKKISIILGKSLAQTVRGLIQGVIVLILALLLFNVGINGSILLVFLILFLNVFSFVGLGILITSFTGKEETATMMMMTIMFPMMFLSGVFFPIQQMPGFMQVISKALPLTYAADAMRKVMILGANITAISTDLIFLSVFGGVLLLIAIPLFKKAMKK
ncbi:MAG: ABC transporter permease [Candidatus Thorarchaeota archaeon]